MMARVAPAALVGLALVIPSGARAADASHPLRSLAYDVAVHVAVVTEASGAAPPTKRNIRDSRGRIVSVATSAAGSGDVSVRSHTEATGKIAVDVIQATDDAGLVVDIAETASQRSRDKVRIAVTGDGALLYDPVNRQNVTEEEVAVVRWLARGFYGSHPTEPGTAWTVDQSGSSRAVETYRVLARDQQRVTLEYGLEEKVPGANGFEATRRGSLLYDPVMVVPVKASFDSEVRKIGGTSLSRTHTAITLTLAADSYAARR